MPPLQLRLNEYRYKQAPESADPLDKAPHEAIEPQHRAAFEPNASGLVLPIPASRKNGNGMPLTLPPTVKKDVFLNALLETPTAKAPRRSPLEWAGAMALHVGILAALIIVPLYTTGVINLTEEAVPLVAPPPPPPPPPLAAASAPAPRVVRPRTDLAFKVRRFTAPTTVPKRVSLQDASAPPPDISAVVGASGGVAGGQIGGVVGGVLGGTGESEPPPPPPAARKGAPKLVRVGSGLKAPRQTYSVEPEYPALALQARVHGTVLVDAIIDEHGNVVQAHAISGHPLLIAAALRAVLQWKYEPTSLNGEPISVELQVQVNFNRPS